MVMGSDDAVHKKGIVMESTQAKLQQLNLKEKVKLISGASLWRTFPIEHAGIPILKVSDGPNGVRGDGGKPAASFPVGICLASTWDTGLIEQVGADIADEARSKDVQVVLGPTINIHRTPLAGRNFECYSEDPYLSGMLASAFTTGLQEKRVGACLKHFVCNDSEFERHTISVEVDERTLREIYLRPFEIAIRKSRPWTLMASYNRINGVYACSHDYLINQILKKEWGFEGLVISDWFAAKETVENATGGLDLEMPGPAVAWGQALLGSLKRGEVTEEVIDDKVSRLLKVLDWSGRFDQPDEKVEQAINEPQHRDTAYQAAVEGMVLLKNTGILPLKSEQLSKLALIGPNTHSFRIMGGGSSALRPHYVSTPMDALAEKLPETELVSVAGCLTHKFIPEPPGRWLSPVEQGSESVSGLMARFYADTDCQELILERAIRASTIHATDKARAIILEGWLLCETAGIHTLGLLSTGKARLYADGKLLIDNWQDVQPGEAFFSQGSVEKRAQLDLIAGQSVHLKIEFEAQPDKNFKSVRYGILGPQPNDGIKDAVDLAATADAVLLMVGTNDDWETEGNDRATLALPGDQDELIRRVLEVNANTVVVNNSGSPISMPWLAESPAVIQTWFAGQEFGNALVDILLGKANPSGKLPITFPAALQDTPAYTSYPGEFGKVHYGEGLYVGYRWYTSRDIQPLFAFGHGLSYTSFEYSELGIADCKADGSVAIEFDLCNNGECLGKEAVQVYLQAMHSPVAKPKLALACFAKITLSVGEKRRISLLLDAESFAHWDVEQGAWRQDPGHYLVHVGASSADLRLTVDLDYQVS